MEAIRVYTFSGGVTNYMALMNTLSGQLQTAQSQNAQLRKQLQVSKAQSRNR